MKLRNFNGATSDAGGDVKSMLRKELNLKWDWCFVHIAHAVTKALCRVNGAASAAENPEMAGFVAKLSRAVFQIKHVSTMGIYLKSYASLT